MNIRARLAKLEQVQRPRPDWRVGALAFDRRVMRIYGDPEATELTEADLPATRAEWEARIEQVIENVYSEQEEQ